MEFANDQLVVLLLEDSQKDIELVHQKLTDDFKCLVLLDSVDNKDNYIGCIRNKRYDIILADYSLPGLNAEEALMLARLICPETPFICISETIGEEAAVELLKQGATDYVLKDRLIRLPLAITCAVSEFLEKAEYEKKLKASEEVHKLILDSVHEGIGMYRRDGTLMNVNKNLAERLGLPGWMCLGKTLEDLYPKKIYGDLAKGRLELIQTVYDTGQPVVFEEAKGIRWFNNRYYPIFKDGGIYAVAFISTDVTDKKIAEFERNRNTQLEIEAEMLKKADENKNQFLSLLSHELRNPLATIVAGQSLLNQDIDAETKQQAQEIIRRQISHLCRLVDDLLDISRISTNKMNLQKKNIDLAEVAMLAAEDYLALCREKEILLETNILVSPLYLEADPVRVSQMIGNLLNNALKFSMKSGTVVLTVYKEMDDAVIEVADNGIGIKQSVLPLVFEPLTQGESALNRDYGGLGLGLSVVKGIAELHDGSVCAASEGEGKGSVFTIRLPLTPAGNMDVSDDLQEEAALPLGIVLIEDNRDFADILLSALEMLGHNVSAAYSAAEGLEKIKASQPDVVFCDIGLPEMNGYQVAKTIRENESIKDVFLIALSGYARDEDVKLALAAGFNRHLAKPVDLKTVKKVLSNIKIRTTK